MFFLSVGVAAPLAAHQAEPISTEFALPFEPKVGNIKIGYEYEREGPGASQQSIPEVELELGILPRWQVNVGFPVFRIKESRNQPAQVGGGKLELGTRYLLLGGETRSYAISFQSTIAAPTGNRRIVGDGTGLSGGLFLDRFIKDRVVLHSNLSWGITVGGSQERQRAFEYHHALVWFATFHWIPVFEQLGRTNTVTGRTELAAQPEMIYYAMPHVELKFGMPVGLTSTTPRIGARMQIAIIWGGPR